MRRLIDHLTRGPREFTRNRTLSRVAFYALLMAGYAAIPAWLKSQDRLLLLADVPADLHAALTLVLGWLLVFRTNTSYARWWEARTLWGSLINCIRNLSLKFVVLIDAPRDDLISIRRTLKSFAWLLKDHLREGASLEDAEDFKNVQEPPRHVPGFLVSTLYSQLNAWKKTGIIDGPQLIVIDEDLRKLLEIVGGCERIRNTRLARSYRSFARLCVFLYLGSLPWGIVDAVAWWTVPLTAMLSYFMLGLETVAEHTEEPFGHDEDDLDLEGMCRTIESSVTEIFALRSSPTVSTAERNP